MLIVALGFCLFVVGCQNAENIQNTNDDTVAKISGTNSKCSPGSEKMRSSDLQILGDSIAQAGQAVQYKLNQDIACESSEQVVWKSSQDEQAVVADSLKSMYSKPGFYIVTAEVAKNDKVAREASVISKAQFRALATAEASSVQVLAATTTVVSDKVVLVAPQVTDVNKSITAQLAIPAGTSVFEAIYDFGDGSPLVSSLAPVQHTYASAGIYSLSVAIQGNNGAEGTLRQQVQVLEPDEQVCSQFAAITGPSKVEVGQTLKLAIYMPACMTDIVGSIKWTMGDGVSYNGSSVQHNYVKSGDYQVVATIYKAADGSILFNLKYPVQVVNGTNGGPGTPARTCSVLNQTRQSQSASYTERSSCGLDGFKDDVFYDYVTELCKSVSGRLVWSEVSRIKEIVSAGSCQNQSCQAPDGSIISHGGSKVFYSSKTPTGLCSEAQETRVCNNGVLSGSATQRECYNSCGAFGVHGTVKTDVVTGEVSVAKTCQFGETGIVDIFNQTSTQSCVDGQVINSNTQQSDIKLAGSCPTYSLAPSESYSTCSADCGGTQNRLFKCVDKKNNIVDSVRCEGQQAAIETRACDGNPDAVKREESSVTSEDAPASTTCPANQIGVIASARDVTTVKSYACIDHRVQLANTKVSYGAWVKESYCRDYVARRCSQDSLNNIQAQGRYDWMVKCQDELPLVKEFLTQFAEVKTTVVKNSIALNGTSRHLYPTFMDRSFKPEKPWIAPKVASAPCQMPATAYVATVCVSSCATPEQEILAQAEANSKLKYVPYIEALTQKFAFAGAMQSVSSMSSKHVKKVKVDQWVTELIDTEHDILVFKMQSGRAIKVTPNHPLVDEKGYMRSAQEFAVGDSLVQLGGDLDPIISITPIKYQGKVYNIFVQSAAIHNNILVLNGYLNGSAYFQNDGARAMNKALFRKAVVRGAF